MRRNSEALQKNIFRERSMAVSIFNKTLHETREKYHAIAKIANLDFNKNIRRQQYNLF